MAKAGMATHSISSFNESKEIRILSEFLEAKHTVKTFFKENDRTPNYDGSFELVNDELEPQKQFIVQIKKVENLAKETKGKNAGKYIYQLETPFLFYVKAKVTESPAFYFVVDICTKNIFALFLSDELLMNLNFEANKSGKITYAFSEDDIINDIDSFTNKLREISEKRNALFLNKTPEEIAELQDAIDFINQIMENDLKTLKNEMLPNLWRFGIRWSKKPSIELVTKDTKLSSPNTLMYALYPQIKGVPDTGISEYIPDEQNFFATIDMVGNKPAMEYIKASLKNMVKTFFENGIPAKYMPDIALYEQLNVFEAKLKNLYLCEEKDGKIVLKDMLRGFMLLMKYVDHIVYDTLSDEREIHLKSIILGNQACRRTNSLDIIAVCDGCGCRENFREFAEKHPEDIRCSDKPFRIVAIKYIKIFVMINELLCRKIETVEKVWNYNYYELTMLSGEEWIDNINKICRKWFAELPQIYNACFDRMFEKNKYRYKGKFEYKNVYYDDLNAILTVSNEYEDGDLFSISFNEDCFTEFTDEAREKGVKTISTSAETCRAISKKTMIYNSLTYLLYEGVCNGLGISSEKISFSL